MDEGIYFRELQEAQKKLESVLQAEVRKREIRESKLEQQISEIGNGMQEKMKGIDEKLEHITNTLAKMQSLIAKNGKWVLEEEEIIGESCVISAKEECNTKREQISEPTRGEIVENRPEIVVDSELDRDWKMHSDGSIYSNDFSSQGMHIVNPLPMIDSQKFDAFHHIYWILESNKCDIKPICSCNSDGIGKIDGFLEKNVTFDPLYSILVMFFIEIQVGNFHILLKFHVVRGYDLGGTFGKGRSTINGIQSQFKALLEASSHGHSQLVELLMGSDLIRPHATVYALITACCRGFVEVVDTLIKCKQISVVQLLLKAGIRTDVKVQLGAWSWDMASGEEF
ncbi:hypothetical protein ACS0TY_022472 [Phlomoides rotata]